MNIIIASPYSRNDNIEKKLSTVFSHYNFIRFKSSNELKLSNLKKINPSIIFFPHWSWIIPEEVHLNYKCIIFHMTDLPFGRGGSPLQNLIMLGHKETKISALHCVSQLDAGPIYMKSQLSLSGTADEILKRASTVIEQMIHTIIKEDPKPIQQSGVPVDFKRRKPEDGNLQSLENVENVYNHIRMLDGDGYPRAFIEVGNFRFEFDKANIDTNNNQVLANVKIFRKENE